MSVKNPHVRNGNKKGYITHKRRKPKLFLATPQETK